MQDHNREDDLSVPTWSASLLQCIGASGIGILVGVAMVHAVSPVFAQELFEPLGLEPTPEQIVRYKSSLVHFWTRNNAFDFAMLGTTFGFALGLLTTSWKRVSSALAGGVLGLVSGASGGYLASRWAVAAFIVSSDQSLFRSIAINTIVWGGLQGSVAMGIGFVQGHARIRALGLAGILSSIIASAIFLILFSVAFPASDLSYLIRPSILEKTVWACTMAIVLGYGLYSTLKATSKS